MFYYSRNIRGLITSLFVISFVLSVGFSLFAQSGSEEERFRKIAPKSEEEMKGYLKQVMAVREESLYSVESELMLKSDVEAHDYGNLVGMMVGKSTVNEELVFSLSYSIDEKNGKVVFVSIIPTINRPNYSVEILFSSTARQKSLYSYMALYKFTVHYKVTKHSSLSERVISFFKGEKDALTRDDRFTAQSYAEELYFRVDRVTGLGTFIQAN